VFRGKKGNEIGTISAKRTIREGIESIKISTKRVNILIQQGKNTADKINLDTHNNFKYE
jgi:hypothetical protein